MVVYSCTASYWGSISLFLLKNIESVTKRQKISLLSHLDLNHEIRALGPHQLDGLVNINLLVPACREGRWEAEKQALTKTPHRIHFITSREQTIHLYLTGHVAM